MCKTRAFYPKLKVDFNESYLNQIEKACTDYATYTTLNSKYQLKSRREYLEEQSRVQEEYLTRLQNEALERFRQYEKEENENRLLELEAKQKRFNFLKQQMELDLKRRQDEKEKQKQDDKEYMDKLVNRDAQFNEEKKRLEEQLKQEIKQEYEEKIRDAEIREQTAKKRIEETTKKIEQLDNSIMDVDMEVEKSPEKNSEFVPDKVELSDVEMEVVSETPVKQKISDQTVEKDFRPSIKIQNEINALTESPVQSYKPSVKISTNVNALSESLSQSYKPSIKINTEINSLTQSPTQTTYKSSVKLSDKYHASKESDLFELEQKEKNRIEWLKSRNLKGHSSDSKIKDYIEDYKDQMDSLEEQNVLRAKRFEHFTKKEDRVEQINFDEIVTPYAKKFPELEQMVTGHFLNKIKVSHDDEVDEVEEFQIENTEVYTFNYINLEEIFNRILYRPVQMQLSLVNRSCINYFLFDLKLEEHLGALRKYVLFENGIFAQKLVDELMVKIEDSHYTGNFFDLEFLLSPIYLREAFNKTCALIRNCKFVENLSIRLNVDKKSSKMGGLLNYLSMIELVYRVDWPINIVINESTVKLYNEIFGFLLKIKFVLSALSSIWHTLRRYGKQILFFFWVGKSISYHDIRHFYNAN